MGTIDKDLEERERLWQEQRLLAIKEISEAKTYEERLVAKMRGFVFLYGQSPKEIKAELSKTNDDGL